MKTNGWRTATTCCPTPQDRASLFRCGQQREWSTLYETEGNPLYQPERFDVASIADTYTLSARMVNQFLVGFHRSTSNQHYGNAFTFSDLGMNVRNR